MSEWDEILTARRPRCLDALCELLRIPSVSADSSRAADVARAADWVARQFQHMGLEVERIATDGHPLIFAQSPPVPGAPTVLVYGHYDVQPPDPLDQWISPPFEPTIRQGNLYARGATDDKGQMLTHVLGAECWLETRGRLPVQLKFLIEGEEEVGSPSLQRLLDSPAGQERLRCDVAVISDTSQFAPGVPAITYGLKGIAYFEVELEGPSQDLHSGMFGGAVANPVNALCKLLGELLDADGRVALPGFYDNVQPLSAAERAQFRQLPFDEPAFRDQVGVDQLSGEQGYSTLERRWARPTCDINGIWGGYQGEGAKTILPSRAGAKVSFRLVPDQQPGEVESALRTFLDSRCPAGVRFKLTPHHGAPGIVVPLDSPYVKGAAAAIESGFGAEPVYIREGGSIPVVNAFRERLHIDTLLLGWGQDDDNLHSPNEKFSVEDFYRGIKTSVHLWEELGRVQPAARRDDAGTP